MTSVAVSPDGKYLVSIGQDCYVQITDLENRKPIHYYRTVEADECNKEMIEKKNLIILFSIAFWCFSN